MVCVVGLCQVVRGSSLSGGMVGMVGESGEGRVMVFSRVAKGRSVVGL